MVRFARTIAWVMLLGFLLPQPAWAWQSKRMTVKPGQAPGGIAVEGQPAQPTPNVGEAKPGDPNKPVDPNKPKEGEKKDGPAPVTTRPIKPTTPPNPDELKNLKPDEEGRVRFNLKGQPWADVLEWLGETSKKSLDWQELPPDYLNLVTQQSYSIDEARDLLNRHLLARGFTMLTKGETISVVSVAKINPGMVPRVEPAELDKLPDHDFVKTSFVLDWMLAHEAEEELKPMLSPVGKLTHLAATNRLEAMDSALNLRQIWMLIQEEQAGGKQERLVREFKLIHTKSAEVLDQLYAILGMNKPSALQKRRIGGSSGGGGGMDPNMTGQFQQQMQQIMQQMQQQAQQNQGAAAGGAKLKKAGEVRIIANEKENSILVNAPPDKMAIIAQAVKTLDVPRAPESHLLRNMQRMQVYRLSGIDPETLVNLLEEVGNLDPTTKLQMDSKNKSIIAYASLADHMTIKLLVDRMDGTSRKFQVMRLRKLEADYVAGSIEFMMGGAKKEETNNRNPYYGYDFGYGGGRSSSSPESSSDKFRVDADVENNRLLLWANEIELREIENLLIKLGELPPPGGNRETQRVIEAIDPDDAEELLERIRKMVPGVIIEDLGPKRSQQPENNDAEPAPKKPPKAKSPEATTTKNPLEPRAKDAKVKKVEHPLKAEHPLKGLVPETLSVGEVRPVSMRVVEQLAYVAESLHNSDSEDLPADQTSQPQSGDETSNDQEPTAKDKPEKTNRQRAADSSQQTLPTIRIRRLPDGRLVLESQNTDALDQLEDLIRESAPPKRDFKLFKLKYPSTWAYSVKLALEEFFEDKDKKKNSSTYDPYYGRMIQSNNQDTSRRLSKRRPLKFISDSDTGTIIVQGATPEQLVVIEDLINIYDQAPPSDGKSVRKTQTFTIKYGKAGVIAESIKDVYRDLLSTNDKALQNQQPGKDGQKPPERNYTFIYGGGDDKKNTPETPVKFKGLISIGVDDVSNTIIVSAPESLLENITELIERLDNAARATNSVQVVKLNSAINSADLQKRLNKIFIKPKQPQQPKPGQPQQPQQPQQQSDGSDVFE